MTTFMTRLAANASPETAMIAATWLALRTRLDTARTDERGIRDSSPPDSRRSPSRSSRSSPAACAPAPTPSRRRDPCRGSATSEAWPAHRWCWPRPP